MSNKSGTSSEVISLPKGGGALSGIGETFSPDLHTGTGNFTVPLVLPPGRNSFQPELNLVYSTGNGNGPFGLGWSLSIPGVSRKTSKGVPVYDDSEDTFVLSGAEDLVPVEWETARTRYRPRTEGLFAHIDHHWGAGDNYWEVQSKDGLVSLYGKGGIPELASDDNEHAVIADPEKRDKVFAWKLTETKDRLGNRIVYEYLRDLGKNNEHHWDQLYLRQIRYVDYEDDEGAGQFLVDVEFEYEDLLERYENDIPAGRRIYPFSDYRAGFEIRTRKRCKRIVVRTHAGEERLVRTYELVYLDERVAAGALPAIVLPRNNVSVLSQIKIVGYDGEMTEELPPLEFGYTRFEPDERRDFFAVEGHLPAGSLGNADLELADLFGNGLPDILEMNGTVRYWRNLGGGRFDLPRAMRDAPAGLALADPGVQLIDANGDGRIDLLVTSNGQSGYFPLQFNGEWDRRSFQRYRAAPSFNLQDPEVKLVDLNGDGVTDVIRSGSRLECFFNDPQQGWNGTRQVARRSLDAFPDINFSDPRIKWGDMVGDGLQDIVLVYDGNIEYWPNLGHGNWGKRVSMRNSPRFPFGYDPQQILLGDVDGDGLADLVYVDHRKIILWINQSGNAWSDPIEIDGTPPVTDMDAVRLVDLLGTGISGVLWSRDTRSPARVNYHFLDFTGGLKPYLLNEMNNHMGAVTRVEYASSTRFYEEDQKLRHRAWKTPLPFPVQVVSRVEAIDEISGGKLTTEYRYHHGYWDGAEREFRGFGMVEQLDTETFEDYNGPGLYDAGTDFARVEDRDQFSPPILTKTWFHQGPIGEEFGEWYEVDYQDEYWPGDPVLFSPSDSLTALLADADVPRRVKRDALRTLRGRILRAELYALDDTERQHRPYTVTEQLHSIREEAPPAAENEHRSRIFFPHTLAQRTTQWERGDQPMTQFSFTKDYDEYGQPRRQIQIACPRSWRRLGDVPGEAYLATYSRTVYARPVDAGVYIVDRIAKTTAYEIENDGSQRIFDLKNVPDDSPSLKVIGQTLNFYDGDAFVGLPLGQVGQYGAVVRSESLVLTELILHAAYKSGDDVLTPPEVPPYLVPGSLPAWTAEYPQAFRDALDELPPLAGYTFYAGGADHANGYYATTTRHRYDFHDPASRNRGLVKVTQDPLGGETTIEYDQPYDVLPTAVTDPAGLTIQAEYDYRVLQPRQVIDPNGNTQRFAFTPLGLPAHIGVVGQLGEGDTDEKPSTRFEYDFLAFVSSPPDNRQPISVCTIRRVHHANDTDVPPGEEDDTIETVEYSDGFGRLVQTRTQAEDILFGEAPFGELDLARAAVVGNPRADGDRVNVVVSGWTTYDNKGRPIEQYESFRDSGWDYLSRAEAQAMREADGPNVFGQKATLFYDPRGQVVRTINPDGSEQRVIYGVPEDLTDPERFTPTAWDVYTYDANDNAGRTHPAESAAYEHHWNTPASIEIDALGRTIRSVERNGRDLSEWYTTRSTYDIRGNLLSVTDALGRKAFRYTYDLANNPLRIENIDAGVRRTVLNGVGGEIERRDDKGALILQAYDVLQRPIRLWARDDANSSITLRERLEYGDGGDPKQSEAERAQNRRANRLDRLHKYYDEAGLLTFEAYDFKGNLLEKIRQVISDRQILQVFDSPPSDWRIQPFRVDWQPPDGVLLDEHTSGLLNSTEYRISTTYDALNRVKQMRYPQDVDGERKLLRPKYNQAGALEQVTLDDDVYVEHIAYNAKGQRILIAYGNGGMTRYAYDTTTFRLRRMLTQRYEHLERLRYERTGTPLQDFRYTYDLAGNILSITDWTPGSGVQDNPQALLEPDLALRTLVSRGDALVRRFSYDPLYRLISATGRECRDIPRPRPWRDDPHCGYNSGNHGTPNQDNAPNLTAVYEESYSYDPAGNMLQLRHSNNGSAWIRHFGMGGLRPAEWQAEWRSRFGTDNWSNPLGNKLTHVGDDDPGTPQTHHYDANGNMIRENGSRHFEWDHSDRMKMFRTQAGTSEPSVHAHYLYDASGQRVMKLVRKQGGAYEVRVYIDGVFEHYRWEQDSADAAGKQHNSLHVMDDQQRIAIVRAGERHPDEQGPTVQYHLGDHLGSSNLVVNGDGGWINREEYFPYGETSFGSFAKKRYRFTGKERDEESGLYYHGARYYAPSLKRWLSPDPAEAVDTLNLYEFVSGNPIKLVDLDGLQGTEITPQEEQASACLPSGECGPNNVVQRSSDPQINPVTPLRGPSIGPAPSSTPPYNPQFERIIFDAAKRGFVTDWEAQQLDRIFRQEYQRQLQLAEEQEPNDGDRVTEFVLNSENLETLPTNTRSERRARGRSRFQSNLQHDIRMFREIRNTTEFLVQHDPVIRRQAAQTSARTGQSFSQVLGTEAHRIFTALVNVYRRQGRFRLSWSPAANPNSPGVDVWSPSGGGVGVEFSTHRQLHRRAERERERHHRTGRQPYRIMLGYRLNPRQQPRPYVSSPQAVQSRRRQQRRTRR